jgi:hypothetical protein
VIRGRAVGLNLALVIVLGGAHRAAAQGWNADLYAGGTRAQGVAAAVNSTSVVGNLRYQSLSWGGGYLSVGAPLDQTAAFWGATGFARRMESPLGGGTRWGVETSADAFAFRDRITDTSGGALSAQILPFVNAGLPTGIPTSIELRGGLRRVALEKRVTGAPRNVWELGGRASLASSATAVVADARWLRGDSATYPYAGAQLVRAFTRGRVWASAGRWLGALDQTGGELGGSVAAGDWGELWASVRQDATDPLYGNAARRSWNVGFSRALGRRPVALPAPVIARGRVRISLAETAVPESAAGVRVAGEFNRWMPAPMARAGNDWVLELPLGTGVYRFAFVTASGEWFVPEGYPGRMDDDMGGHVAVLVVP